MFKKVLFLCTIGVLGTTLTARAGTIGGAGCSSCFGSTYTLTFNPTGTANQYDIFLDINAVGYTGTATNLLNAVAVKVVSNSSDITADSIVSPPTPNFFDLSLGGLSANGCSVGSEGFLCDQYNHAGSFGLQVKNTGDVYTFEWLITTLPGQLLTGDNAASVKALYVDNTGKQAGLTSEAITLDPRTPPVPEPSTLVLLGSGILSAAGLIRRRFAAARA